MKQNSKSRWFFKEHSRHAA